MTVALVPSALAESPAGSVREVGPAVAESWAAWGRGSVASWQGPWVYLCFLDESGRLSPETDK